MTGKREGNEIHKKPDESELTDPRLPSVFKEAYRKVVNSPTAWMIGEVLHRNLLKVTGRGIPHTEVEFSRDLPDTSLLFHGSSSETDNAPSSERFESPIRNPVLTGSDIDDYGDVDFVADPFLIHVDDKWHMFLEVCNKDRTPSAAIGHAVSDDGYHWMYNMIVLNTEYHLSFPYVFEAGGKEYLIPDTWEKDKNETASVILYRASGFPQEWEEVATIITPTQPLHDAVVFQWDRLWWAIMGDGQNLYAFYNDKLECDNWSPHRSNPIVENRPNAARPGGRPIVYQDSIVLFLQDCGQRYGEKVRAYKITGLTPNFYEDTEMDISPVLTPSSKLFGWNTGAMHHIDLYRDDKGWRCAVDGNIGFGWRLFGDHHWAIGIYDLPSEARSDTMSVSRRT